MTKAASFISMLLALAIVLLSCGIPGLSGFVICVMGGTLLGISLRHFVDAE